tara:strand:- start:101 stop:547 length:447 start_codon:yes stop_codon:yes gene_type:complete
MKKLIQSIFFIFTLSVFAHEPGEPIKVKCFVADVTVITISQQPCYKDNIPDDWDEDRVTSGLGCLGYVNVGYSKGLHDLEKLRNAETNMLGWKVYDMKTEISFKDGKKYISVSQFSNNFPGVNVIFTGEKVLRLFNREVPTSIKCEIL